jgi:hypothetical protein
MINHSLPYRRLYEVSGGGWLNRCHMHHNCRTALIRLSPIIAQGNLTRVGVPPAYIAAQSNAAHIGFQKPPITCGALHGTPEFKSQASFTAFLYLLVLNFGEADHPQDSLATELTQAYKNFIRRHTLNATS